MNFKRTPKRIALLAASTVALTVGVVGGAFAIAGDDDAHERPIPAAELDQAERAALEETGGGTVTGTEVDDEESKYEVEVTRDDGTQVDVQLDANFKVVGTESDGHDDESGSDEPGDN
jgi:Peptidase propeptide and YPEB domain